MPGGSIMCLHIALDIYRDTLHFGRGMCLALGLVHGGILHSWSSGCEIRPYIKAKDGVEIGCFPPRA